jgi:hypothetical protein
MVEADFSQVGCSVDILDVNAYTPLVLWSHWNPILVIVTNNQVVRGIPQSERLMRKYPNWVPERGY